MSFGQEKLQPWPTSVEIVSGQKWQLVANYRYAFDLTRRLILSDMNGSLGQGLTGDEDATEVVTKWAQDRK